MSSAATLTRVSSTPFAVPAAVGFFFAFRACVTVLGFQEHPVAATAATFAIELALLFVVWCSTSDFSVVGAMPSTVKWVIAYLSFVLLSLYWSQTGSTLVALMYWLGLALDCFLVYRLTADGSVEEKLNAILYGFILGAAAGGLIAWMLPTMPDLRIGNEDFLHPNALGYMLSLATLFAITLGRRVRAGVPLAFFCGLTLLRTLSKTSISAFAIAMIYYLLRGSHLARRAKVIIAVTAIAAVIASWGLLEAYAITYHETENAETLTGRTYLWDVTWQDAWQTPLLGRGFYSYRFVIPVLGDFEPWEAHNEVLQQFFCYGVAGLAIYLGLNVSLIRSTMRRRKSRMAVLAFAVIIFAVARGVLDTERFDVNFPLWLTTLFAIYFHHPNLESE
ncbi:MAG TPA: O-antigen ligase family protein [Candidatus Koribacter sp.]|jgi:O-antigen ligase